MSNQNQNLNTDTKQQLTVRYLIDLLNPQINVQITKYTYLIDYYQTLKINNLNSYNNLLFGLLIASKKNKYNIDQNNFEINVDDKILANAKIQMQTFINESQTIDSSKKKKYISFMINQNQNLMQNTTHEIYLPPNDHILILTHFFCINLIIYNSYSQIIKCYYYDQYLNRDLPFVILKETKQQNSTDVYIELVFSENKYTFEFEHQLVEELMSNAIIVGFEQNKQLIYSTCDSFAICDVDKSNDKPNEETNNNCNEVINEETNEEPNDNLIETANEITEEQIILENEIGIFKSDLPTVKIRPIPKRITTLLNKIQTTNYKIF